jgi:hypothetical protein
MSDEIIQELAEQIDRLCILDLRPSGPTGGYIGHFYHAVKQIAGQSLSLAAATCLGSVQAGATVVISTGFCHPERLPQGETDGPPGAAALARAVRLGLGATPLIVGEAAIESPMRACCETLGVPIQSGLPADADELPASGALFQAFPTDPVLAQAAAEELIARQQPAAIVVTEKVGPNHLGVAHSAMGMAIPDGARVPIEYLLEAAHTAHIPTIGVGDNGNDIGFGIIEDIVRRYKPYADVCQCPCGGGLATVTKTTHLVTAAVANWGAYGIVACLAAMQGKPDLLHSAEQELSLIDACVEAGAADGITGRYEATVDGLAADIHRSIVTLLNALIRRVT